jgi:hypothetical protein
MQPFLFSALISFVVFEFLVFIHFPPQPGELKFGGVTLQFDNASAAWAQWLLKAAFIIAVLVSILFAHEIWFPQSQILAHKTNITLGFLFGPLFAVWINGVFRNPPDQPLGRGLIVGGIGLVFFCFIGAAGDQTAKLLTQIGKKISDVKGLGVEVSLSQPVKKDPSLGATSLAGSSNRNFAPDVGSSGLEYISQLDEIIRRDKNYLKVLFGRTDADRDQLDRAEDLAKTVIQPPMSCLASWLEVTADAAYVNERVGLFVTSFRQVPTLGSDERRADVSRSFARDLAVIAADVEFFAAPPKVETACAPLLRIFCKDFVPLDSGDNPVIVDRPGLMECLRKTKQVEADRMQPDVKEFEDKLSGKLKLYVVDDGWKKRPYFAIAYASLMAQLGEYTTAAAVLDGWVDELNARPDRKAAPANDWFELRTRSIQAAYFEEWLLKLGNSAATALRDEHLTNLNKLRGDLANYLTKDKEDKDTKDKKEFITKRNSQADADKTILIEAPGACTKNIENLDLWRQLFSSYVSMEMTHIQNRLHHPSYKSKHYESANTDIARLANLDLSCLSSNPEPNLIYAQILDAYALSAVQYVAVKKDTISSDEKDKRYSAAQQAIQFGLEMTENQNERDKNRGKVAFLERIAPSDWVSTHESLEQTRNKLQAAMDE